MKTFATLLPRLLACAVALALPAVLTTGARADYAYGYATQTISDLTITPGVGGFSNVSAVTTATSAAATINGNGPATAAPLDASEAYLGGAPPAGQNFFGRYAPGVIPISPVGDFTRGDSLIASLSGPSNSASVVSESYVNGAGFETASSTVTASVSFTLTQATALTIGYNYFNDIFVSQTGGSSAAASFNFDITLKNAGGSVLFGMSSNPTNLSLAAPPTGPELIVTGSESFTTGVLSAGSPYTLIVAVHRVG